MKKLFISTAILALLASCTNKEAKNESTEEVKTENTISKEKIVSLNGAITEILADLGWTIIWSEKERELFEKIPEEDFYNGEWL